MEHSKLQRFLELKKLEAEISKEMNAIKNEIREAFSVGDTVVDGIKVSRRLQIRIDLDKEAVLKKLGEKAYKDCEKATQYEVVVVKAD